MDAEESMTNVTEINHSPFGHLRYGKEYGVEYWRGSITLSCFEQPFALIVRAGRGGPSQQQAAALTAVVKSASMIQQQATTPMVKAHREAGISFETRNTGNGDVWSILQPEEIEVSDESYYRDGRIFVALIFGSTQEPSFAPAIETVDGIFVRVLSGT